MNKNRQFEIGYKFLSIVSDDFVIIESASDEKKTVIRFKEGNDYQYLYVSKEGIITNNNGDNVIDIARDAYDYSKEIIEALDALEQEIRLINLDEFRTFEKKLYVRENGNEVWAFMMLIFPNKVIETPAIEISDFSEDQIREVLEAKHMSLDNIILNNEDDWQRIVLKKLFRATAKRISGDSYVGCAEYIRKQTTNPYSVFMKRIHDHEKMQKDYYRWLYLEKMDSLRKEARIMGAKDISEAADVMFGDCATPDEITGYYVYNYKEDGYLTWMKNLLLSHKDFKTYDFTTYDKYISNKLKSLYQQVYVSDIEWNESGVSFLPDACVVSYAELKIPYSDTISREDIDRVANVLEQKYCVHPLKFRVPKDDGDFRVYEDLKSGAEKERTDDSKWQLTIVAYATVGVAQIQVAYIKKLTNESTTISFPENAILAGPQIDIKTFDSFQEAVGDAKIYCREDDIYVHDDSEDNWIKVRYAG